MAEISGECLCGGIAKPKKMNRFLRPKWVIAAAGIAAAAILAKRFGSEAMVKQILASIAGLGPWGPVAFIGLYIVAAVLFIPGLILTMSAGFMFGLVYGTIYVSIGATLGAACAFLVGRYLARGWVAKKLETNSNFKAIDQAVAHEGWKIVGLARLSPVFPFNLLNYAFGLTDISLKDYFIASWAGMIPGIVMYVYIGTLAGDLAKVGSAGGGATPARWALEGAGLIATIAVTVYVTRLARKALKNRTS